MPAPSINHMPDHVRLTVSNLPRVSSKATLRIPLSELLPRIPKLLHPSITTSRYLAPKSSDLVIQADEARKQTDNVNACFRKLHELLLQVARDTVPGETSPEQAERVKRLQKAEAASRRKLKDHQSKKKTARRSSGRGDD
jgi:peptidyl-tRNA hydrolase ICT1